MLVAYVNKRLRKGLSVICCAFGKDRWIALNEERRGLGVNSLTAPVAPNFASEFVNWDILCETIPWYELLFLTLFNT